MRNFFKKIVAARQRQVFSRDGIFRLHLYRFHREGKRFRKVAQEANRHRFATGEGKAHQIVDLVETPREQRGSQGAGSVHHIAWRVPTDAEQVEWRSDLLATGLEVTPVIDRTYFHSIYYREPSGILFEIATDPPGFTVDEPLESLGQKLVLPAWLEPSRTELSGILPKLEIRETQHA